MEDAKQPVVLVIFGITGDLSRRKLLPALYHLFRDNLLHPDSKIIGVTRQSIDVAELVDHVDRYARTHERTSPTALQAFRRALSLYQLDMTKGDDYAALKLHLEHIETQAAQPVRRLYYLSIPPAVFDNVVQLMGAHGLADSSVVTKQLPSLLVEKPFGYDESSAKYLVEVTRKYFKESQIYRIDHYLAKEMAQNILSFRFQNSLFAGVWDNRLIRKVVITADEKISIEGRSQFYEQTGALRDLIQSHLLQLMSLVAMEHPTALDGPSIHAARLKLLEAVQSPEPYQVGVQTIRGQYQGYDEEAGNPGSTVETFAAVKLFIDAPRWHAVPFVLRTGKALADKKTLIQIYFGEGETENMLSFHLQPDEGLSLDMRIKRPGHGLEHVQTDWDFRYDRTFAGHYRPEAYERVLLDSIRRDQTLFASSEEVLASWRIIQPILDEWAKNDESLIRYKQGSHGPLATDAWGEFINTA